jgi:hypothetical protein
MPLARLPDLPEAVRQHRRLAWCGSEGVVSALPSSAADRRHALLDGDAVA